MSYKLTAIQWIIVIWFATSVAALVLWHTGFYYWLRSHGVRIPYLARFPGGKEQIYARWRREQGRRPGIAAVLIYILAVNAAVAAALFWSFVASRMPPGS